MNIIDLLPDLSAILNVAWTIFKYGGWVFFVLIAIYILFEMYMNEIQGQYVSTIEWTIFEIKVPRENLTSFKSVEQIFVQLHQLYDNFTFQERFLEGKIVFWMSLEIISLGGKISFLLRVPTKQKDLVSAAFYAQYPTIELNEVEDYLKNFNYHPDDPKFDFFGTEFIFTEPQAVSLLTYRDFEKITGPDKEEKVIDPLSPLLEVFNKIGPNEFYGLQFIIKPVQVLSWKSEANKLVEELQGDETFLNLSDSVKEKINGIQRKLAKPAFDTKIRMLHIGLAEDFNKNAKKLLLSPLKVFGTANGNSLRPSFATKLDYKISPTLEETYIKSFVRRRKIDLFEGYKSRSMWVGDQTVLLSTEELATLWHLPISADSNVPLAQTMDVKKIQPPANLPI